jgi:hypothetical protein
MGNTRNSHFKEQYARNQVVNIEVNHDNLLGSFSVTRFQGPPALMALVKVLDPRVYDEYTDIAEAVRKLNQDHPQLTSFIFVSENKQNPELYNLAFEYGDPLNTFIYEEPVLWSYVEQVVEGMIFLEGQGYHYPTLSKQYVVQTGKGTVKLLNPYSFTDFMKEILQIYLNPQNPMSKRSGYFHMQISRNIRELGVMIATLVSNCNEYQLKTDANYVSKVIDAIALKFSKGLVSLLRALIQNNGQLKSFGDVRMLIQRLKSEGLGAGPGVGQPATSGPGNGQVTPMGKQVGGQQAIYGMTSPQMGAGMTPGPKMDQQGAFKPPMAPREGPVGAQPSYTDDRKLKIFDDPMNNSKLYASQNQMFSADANLAKRYQTNPAPGGLQPQPPQSLYESNPNPMQPPQGMMSSQLSGMGQSGISPFQPQGQPQPQPINNGGQQGLGLYDSQPGMANRPISMSLTNQQKPMLSASDIQNVQKPNIAGPPAGPSNMPRTQSVGNNPLLQGVTGRMSSGRTIESQQTPMPNPLTLPLPPAPPTPAPSPQPVQQPMQPQIQPQLPPQMPPQLAPPQPQLPPQPQPQPQPQLPPQPQPQPQPTQVVNPNLSTPSKSDATRQLPMSDDKIDLFMSPPSATAEFEGSLHRKTSLNTEPIIHSNDKPNFLFVNSAQAGNVDVTSFFQIQEGGLTGALIDNPITFKKTDFFDTDDLYDNKGNAPGSKNELPRAEDTPQMQGWQQPQLHTQPQPMSQSQAPLMQHPNLAPAGGAQPQMQPYVPPQAAHQPPPQPERQKLITKMHIKWLAEEKRHQKLVEYDDKTCEEIPFTEEEKTKFISGPTPSTPQPNKQAPSQPPLYSPAPSQPAPFAPQGYSPSKPVQPAAGQPRPFMTPSPMTAAQPYTPNPAAMPIDPMAKATHVLNYAIPGEITSDNYMSASTLIQNCASLSLCPEGSENTILLFRSKPLIGNARFNELAGVVNRRDPLAPSVYHNVEQPNFQNSTLFGKKETSMSDLTHIKKEEYHKPVSMESLPRGDKPAMPTVLSSNTRIIKKL